MEKGTKFSSPKLVIPSSLLEVSYQARKLTEKFASLHPDIGLQTTLRCYCAVGSRILFLLAKKKKKDNFPQVRFIQGSFAADGKHSTNPLKCNHCWNLYQDIIVDITATQFTCIDSEDVVHLEHIASPRYHARFKNMKFNNWQREQSPSTWDNEIKELVNNSAG
jgi:hypothetical protein